MESELDREVKNEGEPLCEKEGQLAGLPGQPDDASAHGGQGPLQDFRWFHSRVVGDGCDRWFSAVR